MDTKIIEKINKDLIVKRPDVGIGDTVKLNLKIKEANKERIQVFEGIVIAMSGSGLNRTITVRKISYGVGVERIVPLYSPTLESIKIIKKGNVKRSKLYYLRSKVGKKALEVNSEYVKKEVVVPTVGEVETETTEVVDDVIEETVEEAKEVSPNEKIEESSEIKEENVVEEKKEEETKDNS